MPNKYEFDAVRWCRTMAKAHWQRNEHDISATFHTVAKEIDRLRADNATLCKESEFYRKQCDMRDEWRDKVEAELTALKEAARPVAAFWAFCRAAAELDDHEIMPDSIVWSAMAHGGSITVSAEQLDALAALAGEG